MSLLSIPRRQVSISLRNGVNINGYIYNNITAIARLLTYEELLRLDSFQTSTDLANVVVEDDVFRLTFDRFLGFPDGMEVDYNSMEAGVVSTISYAIIAKSVAHVLNYEQHLMMYEAEGTAVDSMQLIVSRYTSTPFADVVKYPINILFAQFALIKKTFPNEIILGDPNNGEQD